MNENVNDNNNYSDNNNNDLNYTTSTTLAIAPCGAMGGHRIACSIRGWTVRKYGNTSTTNNSRCDDNSPSPPPFNPTINLNTFPTSPQMA